MREKQRQSAYTYLAKFYDLLMELDYQEWAQYLINTWEKFGQRQPKILDLACGTGTLTLLLAQKGYQIAGLDISKQMLAEAERKASELGLPIKWYLDDLSDFDLAEQFDVLLCTCDGLNYLVEENHMFKALTNAFNHTKAGGLMLFDLNSEMKLREIYGNNSYADLFQDFGYFWDNYYDEERNICQMDLTFFLPAENGLYYRVSERHFEKLWRPPVIIEMAEKIGWQLLGYYAFPTWQEPEDAVERWQFVLGKD
ncbi:MAG: class I SAM-dependent methyltransferase [Firmicutes bacterium]|nr:class I SAM-dependent methyltransferase [Bacillota bacterium]